VQFARSEGIIPAPEPTYAIRATIDGALRCKEEGVSRTIHFNMAAYDSYLSGQMVDYELSQAEIDRALRDLEGRVPRSSTACCGGLGKYRLSAEAATHHRTSGQMGALWRMMRCCHSTAVAGAQV